MAYREVKKDRALFRLYGIAGMVLMFLTGFLWSWPEAVELVVPAPDYEEIFTETAAGEFYEAVGLKIAVLVADARITEDPETIRASTKRDLVEATVATLARQRGWDRNVIGSLFVPVRNAGLLYVGFYGGPEGDETLDPATLHSIEEFGEFPRFPVLRPFNANFELPEFGRGQLSLQDPGLLRFCREISIIARIWNDQAGIDPEVMARKFGEAASARFKVFLWLFRISGAGFGVLFLKLRYRGMKAVYARFCEESKLAEQAAAISRLYGLKVSVVSLAKFSSTRDLDKLASDEYQRLEFLKRELQRERKRLAPLKPKALRAQTAPQGSTGKQVVAPNPEEMKRRRQKEASALLDEFQARLLTTADPSVQAAFLEAQTAKNLGKKIRFLRRAISLLESSAAKKEAGTEVPVETLRVDEGRQPPPNDYVSISMQSELDRLFPAPDFLPQRIDPLMVKGICLALISRDRVGNFHLKEGLLRRSVRSWHERVVGPFDAPAFVSALNWLVRQRVIIEYDKFGSRRYSIDANRSHAVSPIAARLIDLNLSVRNFLTSHRRT